jgi:hypothetical protein
VDQLRHTQAVLIADFHRQKHREQRYNLTILDRAHCRPQPRRQVIAVQPLLVIAGLLIAQLINLLYLLNGAVDVTLVVRFTQVNYLVQDHIDQLLQH